MIKQKLRNSLLALVLLALIPACGGSPAKPVIRLKPCTGYYGQAQCGTLRVYENQLNHEGRKIDLNIVVIKAQGDDPAPDPIFYLAGGPGVAATEDARRQQFPYMLSRNHDLVFVDQRGTGGSNQVLVPTDPPDLSGLTPEQADARAKAWVADYLAHIDMDPRYYTTSMFADDLEQVRLALGYDRIILVGYSYGATAAQYYLRQYEAHVRSVTIGGASLLDIPVFERWAQNSQQALDGIFDLCQAQPSCQAAYTDLRAEFSGLMSRLADQPETVAYTDPTSRQPASLTFTADFLSAVIRAMLKDVKNDSALPLLIHRAYTEDSWTGFTNYYAQGIRPEWWGDQIMERVIRCSEKWAAFDPGVVAQLSQGSFLASWDTSLAQSQAVSCRYTPPGITPEGLDPQPGSMVPVLIFNSQLDPIDPPGNIAGAEALWPNSVALAAPYTSHSISDLTTINCWWAIENQFIQSGSVDGLDTSCLQGIRPPVFALP